MPPQQSSTLLLEIVEVLLPSRDSVGRRASNLRHIIIKDCEKLEALPEDMHNLNSLKQLIIDYREASLIIWKVKSCNHCGVEWGLHRLTSLKSVVKTGYGVVSTRHVRAFNSSPPFNLWNFGIVKASIHSRGGSPPSLEQLHIVMVQC
ncbi:hypothetical protein DVH24_034236 [Malus domestica]|uniref:NB-ARC domain-containing protein n=1 Tax=Malus domestica TaxID=3750 RepID=A0A498KQP4_MALDO|nr:hypothetical protein DVH24_034236 [Malus domestica]